jgi:hypothetical protein
MADKQGKSSPLSSHTLDTKNDFFSVGRPKQVIERLEVEETKDWKDIRPH